MIWNRTQESLPKKPGYYLVACEIEPGYYAINEGEFFNEGDEALIEPPERDRPYDSLAEFFAEFFKAITHTEIIPEDGFYDTKKFLYHIHPDYWAELPALPDGMKNQNDYMDKEEL